MSRSPYLSNPNILAHPDRIVQTVALDLTAQESYLAGSPISAEGKLANDATAIGILLYDVHKSIGGRDGTVVISGRIKQDVAAEWSGVAVSAEAKSALVDITFTGDGARMGGDLPFGETTVTVMEEQTIVFSMDSGPDKMLSYGGTFIPGKTYTVIVNGVSYNTLCVDGGAMGGDPGLYALGNLGNFGLEDTGEPFVIMAQNGMANFLPAENGSYTISIIGIKPLDPKFLPEGVPYVEKGDARPLNIQWDGVVGDSHHIPFDEGVGLYKVSNTPLTNDQLVGSTMVYFDGNADASFEIVDGNMEDMSAEGFPGLSSEHIWSVFEPATYNGISFEEGVYFMYAAGAYPMSLTNPNVIVGTPDVIQPLDKRCMPTDMVEMYLTSSGGKRFKITVDDSGTLTATEVTA